MGDRIETCPPLIETRQLCRCFRRGTRREVRALDGVSLQLPHGSFTVLTGPSGSGKTSLLSLLGLLDRPTSGTLCLDGRDLSGCSDYELARQRRRMGFVFQDFALLPRLTVTDNIAYPLVPRGVGRTKRRQIAGHWLARLRLAHQADSFPHELSGGECQRVALARALAGDPEIVLADEPTSNLDHESSQEISHVLREIHAAGRTLILATHDDELAAWATHTFHLKDGRLVA